MVPSRLTEERRWVVWRLVAGKKPPVDDAGRPLASWQEPSSWLSYEDAVEKSYLQEPAPSGVGFVLGDGWSGIDLDDCRDPETGEVDPRALGVVSLCSGAYVEVSPSGKGLKVFGRGGPWLELTFRPGHVDVSKKTSGYFCVTGEVYQEGDVPDLALDAVETYFGRRREREAEPSAALPEVVRPGSQNQELFREACRHARDGKSETEILAIVRAVAAERCPTAPGAAPWTDADFRTIARSASRYRAAEDPFPKTESGDAEFFARLHRDCVRYDWRRKRWLRFDGVRWAPQEAGEVDRLALETVRARAAAALRNAGSDEKWQEKLKWAVAGESSSRRAHLLDLARREPPVADPGAGWDNDPWILGVPNGVVDLRTGTLREGRPEDLVTMQTSALYDPSATCPRWEATLADIFKDHPELVSYVQKALGYSLTGDCREEVFFLLTGVGRNGKGTIINTVSHVLGEYADDLAFHSLERTREGDKSTNDIAKLCGRRFVTASESTGARFNEARLKQMTGRDPITARFLYAEEFTFVPSFKLWLSVNRLPKVHDDSIGFWSRPHRVPFLQRYDGREDLTLKDYLRETEAVGVLAWLVRGCLAWQREGLTPPPVVREAVDEYRTSQEPLSEFYLDTCVFDAEASTSGRDLREAYVRWCDERRIYGDRRLGPQRFSQELVKRLGPAERGRTGMSYRGVGLAVGAVDENPPL